MGDALKRLSRKRPRRKVVVIGDTGCGKTALIQSLKGKHVPEHHVPTVVENSVTKVYTSAGDGHPDKGEKQRRAAAVDLAIWELGGDERYARVRPVSYDRAHLVVICFAVDNPESLLNAERLWSRECRENCGDVPVILIGCKGDLKSDPEVRQSRRLIPTKGRHEVAQKIGARYHGECSAQDRSSVVSIFTETANVIMDAVPMKKKQRGCTIL